MSSSLSKVENLKKEGNEFFKKKNWKEAIERYTQAIQQIIFTSNGNADANNNNNNSNNGYMKATLLSNRSLCHFQLFEKECLEQKSVDGGDTKHEILLEEVIQDTTSSLEILKELNQSTLSNSEENKNKNDIRSLRAKILYRRAKANYATSQLHIQNANDASTSSSSSSQTIQHLFQQSQQCKIKSVQDLHDLLSFDSKNKLAQSLLISIQQQQQKQQSCNNSDGNGGPSSEHLNHLMASSASTTPVKRALSVICQYYFDCIESKEQSPSPTENYDDDRMKVIQSLQFLYSSLVDDLMSTAQEILSYQTACSTVVSPSKAIRGIQILYNLGFHYMNMQPQSTTQSTKYSHVECQSLAMRILNEACMYLPIMHLLHELHHNQLSSSIQQNTDTAEQQQQHPQLTFLKLINELQHDDPTKYYGDQYEKYIQLSISFYIRYTLYIHIKEDNTIYETITSSEQKDIPSTSLAKEQSMFLIPIIVQIYDLILKIHVSQTSSSTNNSNNLFSSVQSLLQAIITLDPQLVLNQIRNYNNTDEDQSTSKTSTASKQRLLYYYPIKALSNHEVHGLKPRELALYRKRQYMMKQNQKLRCRDHAILFCKKQGLDSLLRHAVLTETTTDSQQCSTAMNNRSYIRREIVISISKIIHCFTQSNENLMQKGNQHGTKNDEQVNKNNGDEEYSLNDEDLKKIVVEKFFSHTLTIEEVDENDESGNGIDQELQQTLIKCLLSTSMLLAHGDLGTWILRKAWYGSQNEWKNLVVHPSNNEIDDHMSMSIASELASAAASVESARSWITSCAGNHDDNIYWKKLLSSENHDVRSGAASAMAKLGLSDKAISSDEGELFSLLEVAGGLIIGEDFEDIPTQLSNSNSITQLERGIELLSYLASKTIMKDEIAHGFTVVSPRVQNSSKTEKSLLEHLVDLSSAEGRPREQMTPSVSYALSTIFSSIAVSIETLRREAFADKEITVEQYDQLQSMGKTNEEKEMEESKVDQDSPEAVKTRIQNMANKGVCTAIVNLIKEGVSERTKEQLVISMMRMATEPSIRGIMIQQGCLSECLKVSKQVSVLISSFFIEREVT